jgi:hypothetical protein
MDESFEIPVHFQGKDLLFPGRLVQYGYLHRIIIDINGTEIYFEPDEERNYRAFISHPDESGKNKIDPDLVRAIVEVIESQR